MTESLYFERLDQGDRLTDKGTPGGRTKFVRGILSLKCLWEMSNRQLEKWSWAALGNAWVGGVFDGWHLPLIKQSLL